VNAQSALSEVAVHDVLDVAGYRARVGSSSELVRATLRSILRGFDRMPESSAEGLPRFELQPVAGEWQVVVNDEVLHQGGDFLVALGMLEFHLVTAALDGTSDFFHLHGAALCAPTRRAAVVIAADSGTGKTTLALALMLRGFMPFSDDVALIEPEALHLRPLRRAFHIAADTWPLLDGLAGGRIRSEADVPPGYFTPTQWAQEPVPVRWVLFLERIAGRTPRLVPMQPAEAAAALIEHSGTLSRSPRLALATTSRLVEQAVCRRFIVDDLAHAVEAVQELVLSAD
jgi:hypothetical protein